jgi:hypothetical protein
LYAGRDRHEVTRLRALALLAVCRLGAARQAWPVALDHLANGGSPLEFAAGARAASALGPLAAEAAPLLIRPFAPHFADDLFDLEHYDPAAYPAGAGATTAVREALRALARIGPAARPAASVAVRRWLEATERLRPAPGSLSRAQADEARTTLRAIEGTERP